VISQFIKRNRIEDVNCLMTVHTTYFCTFNSSFLENKICLSLYFLTSLGVQNDKTAIFFVNICIVTVR